MKTLQKYHYTYRITNLKPTDELEFYVGVRSCSCLPEEDAEYMGSSSSLTEAINTRGREYFQKEILHIWDSRASADAHEKAIHKEYDAAQNPQFYNKKNGVVGFHVTPESTRNGVTTRSTEEWQASKGQERISKIKAKMTDPTWKATIGEARNSKHKETKASAAWKATTGAAQRQKQAGTLNDPTWKATTGAEQNRKHKETLCDHTWKETNGKERQRKLKETLNDPNWKASKGADQSRKMKETKATTEWIAANTFVCPHCNRSIKGRGMFNKWHDDNCKLKEIR